MCDSHDVSDQTRSADPRSGYRLAEQWPIYPEDMQFEMGSGIAVDAEGVVYLFTRDIEHWAAHPLAQRASSTANWTALPRDVSYSCPIYPTSVRSTDGSHRPGARSAS